jgi:hypothetical protein
VPVVGFIDDAGKRVKFADIAKGRGEWWLPRPLLRALSRSYRSADHYGAGDVISVTTLGNPVQADTAAAAARRVRRSAALALGDARHARACVA